MNLAVFAQYGKQQRADHFFNTYSFVNAAKEYRVLIDNHFDTDYAIRQLGDCYAYMRNPDSATVYYQKAVEQNNVPIAYYYKYAQSLRGIKDYEGSRIWLEKYKQSGGKMDGKDFLNDSDFISSIFNAKPHYFLKTVNFNSKFSDFGAYEHDDKLYFTSARDMGVSSKHRYAWDGQPFLDVYVKDKNDTTQAVDHKNKIKGTVNSVYHDGPITISNDGKTMYFSRNNYNKNSLHKDAKGISNLKIFKASLVDGQWTNIQDLPFNSDEYSTGHPALNNDNTKLYFASDMPGGQGGSDIYYVDVNPDGSYGNPKNLGNIVNTNKNEVFPFVNKEGTLFFSSDGHQGLGMLDIFAAITNNRQSIVSVLNLGIPINSNKDDFSFFMSPDGTKGYFASNRDGGAGSDDIYAYDRILPLKLSGHVTDAVNNNPIAEANVSIFDSAGNKIADLKTEDNGLYTITIERDTNYKLMVSHEKYNDQSKYVSTKDVPKTANSLTTDVSLTPQQDVVKLAELNTIYFGFEKYDVSGKAALELDKIANMMLNTYPEMVIRIESHTDSRGTVAFNDWLSQKRAKSTYDYLVSKGINPHRIAKYEGFGERRLTNGCDGSKPCTEAEHQLNRRTEFIVIKMK